LVQLRTGHAQLQRHLYKMGLVGTLLCPSCHQKEETVRHFLLSCIAHVRHRQPLINTLRCDALDLAKLLSDPDCIDYMLDYVHATKRFHPTSTRLPPCTPPPTPHTPHPLPPPLELVLTSSDAGHCVPDEPGPTDKIPRMRTPTPTRPLARYPYAPCPGLTSYACQRACPPFPQLSAHGHFCR
ncbi:hypothetical protein JB92DRAFT_2766867, partial [Gautieria morchelliformis]